jgi:FKBP-type peptidyl-prolyl cis-trans isomerase SlyD
MDNNNYIVLSYSLFAEVEGERMLLEQTEEGKPFWFISGMGMTLPKFEKELAGLSRGEAFDFVIAKDEAYGAYDEEHIVDLDKKIFMPDGKFDEKIIHVDAIIPLMNADGNRFNARVLEITADKVTVDLNHPYAGLDLNFKGEVLENRPATAREMEQMARMLSGEGCGGCGGGDCGDCGGGDCGDCGGCGGGGCGNN